MATPKTDQYLKEIAQQLKVIADELKKTNRRADRAERLSAGQDITQIQVEITAEYESEG